MSTNLITAYRYDKQGFYLGAELIQEGLLPPDVTLTAPTLKDGYWSQWSGKTWTQIKKPATAAECVGLSVKHEDNSAHAIELRELFKTLTDADSEHYQISTDDAMTQSVKKIEVKTPTLDELKTQKEHEIDAEFKNYQAYNASDCYLTSSLGFQVNADACSVMNIETLIGMLNDDTSTVSFRVYDNSCKQLTKPQLQTLLSECKQNGLKLYEQKFALLSAVSGAKTADDVNKITIAFAMADFAAKEDKDKTEEKKEETAQKNNPQSDANTTGEIKQENTPADANGSAEQAPANN